MTQEELQAQLAAKAAEIEALKPKEQEKASNTTEVTTEAAEMIDQVDPIVEEAIKMGWDPDHKGPNKKTAEQFVKDGSFFRKIDAQNKKIDDLLSVVKNLDEHSRKLQQANLEAQKRGYEQAMRELQIKEAEAVADGDLNKFHQVRADIAEVQKTKPVEVSQTKIVEPSEEMKTWAKENSTWFDIHKNPRLVKEASGLYDLEVEENPNRTDREILETVKETLMRAHPDKFEQPNPNKTKPAAVLKGRSSGSTSSTSGLESRLTERQLKLFKQAKDAGIKMTIQEYAKQLEITGALRND